MRNNEFMEYTKLVKLKTRDIVVNVKGCLVEAEKLDKYVNISVKDACEKGCPNYNKKWSCPPLSKEYKEVRRNYKYSYLICFSTKMNQYLDIKNKYLAVKAANVSLKTIIEKFTRSLEESYKGYSLLSGSCRLCKPCNRKLNKGCRRPEKMRYSMEATYLQVDNITNDILHHKLLWYSNKTLPEYTSTCSLLLLNEEIDNNSIQRKLDSFLENY